MRIFDEIRKEVRLLLRKENKKAKEIRINPEVRIELLSDERILTDGSFVKESTDSEKLFSIPLIEDEKVDTWKVVY
ncbi:hypothetical protein D3C81_173820 [compost metagenome]